MPQQARLQPNWQARDRSKHKERMENMTYKLQKQYDETLIQLSKETGWSKDTTTSVLNLLLAAARTQQNKTALLRMEEHKNRITATKELMKNYHQLKAAVSSGISRTLDVMDDTEIQRLMEREESVRNQQVRSLALQHSANKVLFLRLNAALDEMKTICEADSNPRIKRQYGILYSRYIHRVSVEGILELYNIEQTEFFRTQKAGFETLAVLLFGANGPSDFAQTA